MKSVVLSLLAISVVVGAALAGPQGRFLKPYAIDRGDERPTRHLQEPTVQSPQGGFSWVVVDSMANAFGPASNRVKPITYDPNTGWLTVIHRGKTPYAAGSGQLWYNRSTDGGQTWRRISELNAGTTLNLRYPSATIRNYTQTSDTASVMYSWAAPNLDGAGGTSFGGATYGVDFPIGSASTYAVVDDAPDSSFWSNLSIWASTNPNDSTIFWTCYRRTDAQPHNDYWLWRTQDYVNTSTGIPASWATSNFVDFGLDVGGTYRNGVSYFSRWGIYAGQPTLVDNAGYSKSTDNGATWSAWVKPDPDWRMVPGLGMQYDMWSYGGAGAYSCDMLVDANNKAHFFIVVFDTLSAERSLVEYYEGASGWQSQIITNDLKESTELTYPGTSSLNQMGNHLNAAISADGTVMALAWLDAANQGETVSDIWFSQRSITGTWSTPENLTQTPTQAEILLHAAPVLRSNGSDSYTMFLGRSYEIGVTTWPPVAENPTNFYVGSHTFTASSTSAGENPFAPDRFVLSQNYPNPFNPTTSIRYEVPVRTHVRIDVHNVLGQSVATIVDENKEAGTYYVHWNAGGSPSGVYYYTMHAGSQVSTRKMLLLK